MAKDTQIKFCGLTRSEDVDTAVGLGVNWFGLVHFEKSPRHLDLQAGHDLSEHIDSMVGCNGIVALMVNPSDDEFITVQRAWKPAIVQLHGSETPERIQELRALQRGVQFWKAMPVHGPEDLQGLDAFNVDGFLFDAKPPKGADRPGGWGHAFDWRLLSDLTIITPWLLAGGLTPETVKEAIEVSGTKAVDVSSGIEEGPGIKSVEKMTAFVEAARS